MSDRERLWDNWSALKAACNAYHRESMKGGVGGAVMCICGCGCGGSAACSMLRELRDVLNYMPTKTLPKEWREKIESLRDACY